MEATLGPRSGGESGYPPSRPFARNVCSSGFLCPESSQILLRSWLRDLESTDDRSGKFSRVVRVLSKTVDGPN